MLIPFLILSAGAVWLVLYSRKRIAKNASEANTILEVVTVNAPAPELHPLQERKATQAAIDSYNTMLDDLKRLERQYELVRDKTSPRGRALATRLAQKSNTLTGYKQQLASSYPNILFS